MNDGKPNNVFQLFASGEGVDDFSSFIDEQDIELDPVSGATIVGVLNETERRMYTNVLGIEARLEDLGDEIFRQFNMAVADGIVSANGAVSEDLLTKIRSGKIGADYAEELFYLTSLRQYKHAEFWFRVRKRLQTFAKRLSVRAGYNIVSTGDKTEI